MKVGARYYDPKIGRWIQRDPILSGFNWWVYCGNDPVNRVDPSGSFYVPVPVGDFYIWEYQGSVERDGQIGYIYSVQHVVRYIVIEFNFTPLPPGAPCPFAPAIRIVCEIDVIEESKLVIIWVPAPPQQTAPKPPGVLV